MRPSITGSFSDGRESQWVDGLWRFRAQPVGDNPGRGRRPAPDLLYAATHRTADSKAVLPADRPDQSLPADHGATVIDCRLRPHADGADSYSRALLCAADCESESAATGYPAR